MNRSHSKVLFLLCILIFALAFITPTTVFADNWSFGVAGAAVSVFPGDFDGDHFILADNDNLEDSQRNKSGNALLGSSSALSLAYI